MTSLQNQNSTSQKITALLPRLIEADRVRLLQFAEALLAQKQQKRRQRANRLSHPVNESWKILG